MFLIPSAVPGDEMRKWRLMFTSRQMRGRAGRKGKDEIGETFLCCRKPDLADVVELVHAELPQITSGLMTERHRIQRYGCAYQYSPKGSALIINRALLEVIAIRLATSRDSINDYVEKTLLSCTTTHHTVQESVESSLTDLVAMGFIVVDDSEYRATQLGTAVVASALEPEDGAFVHRELQRALRAFVMDGDMHLLYTFTPVQNFSMNVNWRVFRNEVEALDDSALRVMSLLGLKPAIVNKMFVSLVPGSAVC